MTGKEKRLKQLEARLNDKTPAKVTETITQLRSEEPCQGAIKLLTELYNASGNQAVKNKISDFMNDMKESGLRTEVIGEIRKEYKMDTIKMLVSSCWQSGLDYSPFASDFAMVFNSADMKLQ